MLVSSVLTRSGSPFVIFGIMNKVVGGVAAVGIVGGAYHFLSQPGPPKNAAFVFVKPHAVTPAVNKLVREGLTAKGLKVTAEGDLSSETIDKKKLIDQHYYAIASKVIQMSKFAIVFVLFSSCCVHVACFVEIDRRPF